MPNASLHNIYYAPSRTRLALLAIPCSQHHFLLAKIDFLDSYIPETLSLSFIAPGKFNYSHSSYQQELLQSTEIRISPSQILIVRRNS